MSKYMRKFENNPLVFLRDTKINTIFVDIKAGDGSLSI